MRDDEPVWRTGRHVGHHLYLQKGRRPSDSDEPIGTLFTPELARQAVDAVNAVQRVRKLHARAVYGCRGGCDSWPCPTLRALDGTDG